MRASTSGLVAVTSSMARIAGWTMCMPSLASPAPSRNSSAPAPPSKMTGPANRAFLIALATRLDCGEMAATANAWGRRAVSLATGTV